MKKLLILFLLVCSIPLNAEAMVWGPMASRNGFGNDSHTKLMLHLNNNTTDSSSSAKTVTNSSTTDDSTHYKFGGHSRALNGSSGYLTVPDSDDLNFDGDFTIDFWAYINSLPTGAVRLFQKREPTGNNYIEIDSYIIKNGSVYTIEYEATNASDNALWYRGWYFTPTFSTWMHFAYVKSGTTMMIFLNGVLLTSLYESSGTPGPAKNITTDMNIGRFTEGSGNYLNASIDEFRISKGIARWTKNFVPPAREY